MDSFSYAYDYFLQSYKNYVQKITMKIAGLTSYTALFKVKGRFAVKFPLFTKFTGNFFAHSPLMD